MRAGRPRSRVDHFPLPTLGKSLPIHLQPLSGPLPFFVFLRGYRSWIPLVEVLLTPSRSRTEPFESFAEIFSSSVSLCGRPPDPWHRPPECPPTP